MLVREGDRSAEFLVIVTGQILVIAGHGRDEERVVRVHGPGRFLGELGLLKGEVSPLTAVGGEDTELLAVPLPALGDVNRLPYRFVDLERDRDGERMLRAAGVPPGDTPLVIWFGGLVLHNPSNSEPARALGLPATRPGAPHPGRAGRRGRARQARGRGPRGHGGADHHGPRRGPEARLCGGRPVAVVGDGDSAGQATLLLADVATEVYLVVREDEPGERMSRYLVDRIRRHPRVVVLAHTEVAGVVGDGTLREVVVRENHSGARGTLPAQALFILTGHYAGRAADRDPPPQVLETSRPGVFAVGDVRVGAVRRVASAVADGAAAIRLLHEHLARTGSPVS